MAVSRFPGIVKNSANNGIWKWQPGKMVIGLDLDSKQFVKRRQQGREGWF